MGQTVMALKCKKKMKLELQYQHTNTNLPLPPSQKHTVAQRELPVNGVNHLYINGAPQLHKRNLYWFSPYIVILHSMQYYFSYKNIRYEFFILLSNIFIMYFLV